MQAAPKPLVLSRPRWRAGGTRLDGGRPHGQELAHVEAEAALVARGPLGGCAERAAGGSLLLGAARLARARVAEVAACLDSAVALKLSHRGAVDLLDDAAAARDDALRTPEARREGGHLVQAAAKRVPISAYVVRGQGHAEARAAVEHQRLEVRDAQHARRGYARQDS